MPFSVLLLHLHRSKTISKTRQKKHAIQKLDSQVKIKFKILKSPNSKELSQKAMAKIYYDQPLLRFRTYSSIISVTMFVLQYKSLKKKLWFLAKRFPFQMKKLKNTLKTHFRNWLHLFKEENKHRLMQEMIWLILMMKKYKLSQEHGNKEIEKMNSSM